MPPATETAIHPVTPGTTGTPGKRQRAKALFARLRHKQLLSAMSGKVTESAIYAQRALRIRRGVCSCSD